MANQAAFQAGMAAAREAGEERRAHKQALSDEEFQAHAGRLADEIASNRALLSGIDPQRRPQEYAAKVNDLRQNLQDIRELYHPDRHPNGISKFGHLVTDALKITSGPKRIEKEAARRAAGSARDEEQAQQIAASTPRPVNELADYRDALIGAGFSPEQAQKALEVRAGIEPKAANSTSKAVPVSKPYKGQDGRYYQSMRDTVTGEITEQGMPQGYAPPPPSNAQPVRAWTRDRNGRIVSVLVDKTTNRPIPGSENPDILPPSFLIPKVSSGVYHWVDQDNQVHATPESRTTAPALPGNSGAATPPKSPASTGGAQANRGDKILGTKGSAPLNKARSSYADAVKIADLADRLTADAEQAHREGRNIAESDALFVLALIRSEAGRVNQTEIRQLFQAGGISEAPERWAARVGHGELSDGLRAELQTFAHEQRDAARAAVASLTTPNATPGAMKATAQKNLQGGMSDDQFLMQLPTQGPN